ncbi:MAG: hypothetical protein DRG78_01055 [Epsilonproteobacteria bacterium]|nr:MAG: hypothetical protein DRG78_01055 [Campylobacterota bacterium]
MRVLALIVIFVVTFVISFPKDKVYYFILDNLLAYNIQIEPKQKDISAFGIDLKSNSIYLSQSKIGYVENIDIGILSLELDNIKFAGVFKQTLPNIKELNVYLKVGDFFDVVGDFGSVVGNLNIMDRKIVFKANIKANAYQKYKNIFGMFKKSKSVKGEYIYEFNI